VETQLSNLLYDNPELYEEIYHGCGDEIPRSVENLVISRTGGPPRTLLDLGCGTGRDLQYFAGHGIDCTGVDLQDQMISYARTRRPNIAFHTGDMRSVRLGRTFDTITCLGWAIANIHSNADLNAVIATFAAHARPGTLLFVHLPNAIATLSGAGLRHQFLIDTADFQASAEAVYELDRRHQLLIRRRTWRIPGQASQEDFVRFRLLFPMELEHHLTGGGFSVLGMYDNTTLTASDLSGPVLYVAARFGGVSQHAR
jgi:SAM-dependent methyltransferase